MYIYSSTRASTSIRLTPWGRRRSWCVSSHIYMHICIYMYLHMYMYIYSSTRGLILTRSTPWGRRRSWCIHRSMYPYIHIYTYICIYVYIYEHIYIYAYIYITHNVHSGPYSDGGAAWLRAKHERGVQALRGGQRDTRTLRRPAAPSR